MRHAAALRARSGVVLIALALLGVTAGCGGPATTPRPTPASTPETGTGVAAGIAIAVGAGHTASGTTPTPTAAATPSATAKPAATAQPTATAKPGSTVTATAAPTVTPTVRPAAGPAHILVIMDESQSYAGTLGSCGGGSPDPYWCSLASQYASMTDWSGVEEPYSLPNYLAITGGSTQGCTDDLCLTPDTVTSEDLGGQLTAAGIPWTAYMESMPTACDTDHSDGADPTEYAGWHDPWVYYQDDMPPNSCNVLPYPGVSSMVTTLDSPGAPDFVWITPNLCDDGHDSCTTGEVPQLDAWLSSTLPAVLSSSWFAANGTVIVTMDNGPLATGVGGTIPLTVISATARGQGDVATAGDHFGTLRSIEEAYGLPLLGAAADPANGDLSALFG